MIHAATDISFFVTIKPPEGPNVWVADTGASCGSTYSYSRLTNKKVPAAADGVTLSGGKPRVQNDW
eukprot:12927391-Ditylum_brightwellii.AAC.1